MVKLRKEVKAKKALKIYIYVKEALKKVKPKPLSKKHEQTIEPLLEITSLLMNIHLASECNN